MTEEERQKLITDLREPWKLCDDVNADLAALMTRAADELERLANEVHSGRRAAIMKRIGMTDEERELLIDRLFYAEVEKYTNLVDIDPLILKDAANEIERLADRVSRLEAAATLYLQRGDKLAAENDRLANELARVEEDGLRLWKERG